MCSDRLVAAAQDFRDKNLEYIEDAEAESHYLDNWWEHSAQRKEGRGGNYAAVHMRRADFARSRGDQVSFDWSCKRTVEFAKFSQLQRRSRLLY